ncbi:hypothetical protein [Gabonibacter chumensis]|uniref:golvesin C-terminal-like domain-containing protein n=1 Tax=Gabonibacter chumensis TaxID=2972474 RepID=UPI002573A68A|nr:hypothetical protein [Gabonibacter chumensis]MCR9010729.1 hypothetical protein [Gabonibacter chumensis]
MRYQIKLLWREWSVRLFLFVSLLIPVFFYFGKIYLLFTPEGLPSADPFLLSFLFNSVQPLFILLVAYDLLKGKWRFTTLDVIYVRPVSNFVYFGGKAFGVIVVTVTLNAIVLSLGMFLHLFGSENPFCCWIYLFYLMTLTFPTLCFWLGLSMLAGSLCKGRGVTLLVLLSIWGVSCFYLPGVRHGLFDYGGREIPNLFSDITGHPFLCRYLQHRFAYLLAGAGSGVLGIVCSKRKSNSRKGPVCLLLAGGLLCVCALAVGNFYDREFQVRDARRAEYREVYRKYATPAVVRMLSNDIACRQVRDSLYGSSRVVLQNRTDEAVSGFVLYLNPYLSVISLKEKGTDIEFSREKQVIRIKRMLVPGDSLSLEISYAGKIDDAFCYLELGDTEYDHRELDTRVEMFGVGFRYGNLYSFLSDRFTLLYPECLWYPVVVSPENPDNPLSRQFDYSRYSLSVENKEGRLVVSQGKREEENGWSIFKSRDNLPGIVLCIGNFERQRIEIDSLELEWYYFRGRNWGDWELPLSFEKKKEILESSLNFYERCYQKPYLFKEFKVVEVPVTFAAHQRKWNNNNNSNQPGLVFLPERFAIMSKVNDLMTFLNAEKIQEDDDLCMRVKGYVESLFQGEINNLASLFQDFTGFISDRRYPALDILLKYAQMESPFLCKSFSGTLIELSVDYLSTRSLEEACRDRTLSVEEIDCILYLSAGYLEAYLAACTGEDTFYSFLEDFLRRHPFETVDFELLCKEYKERYMVDFEAIISKIYSRKGLPLFKVRGVEWESLPREEWERGDRLLSFNVFNDSRTEGVISVAAGGIQNRYTAKQTIRSFLLKPGECKTIRCTAVGGRSFQNFTTRLSRNLPLTFSLPKEEEGVAEKEDSCEISDFFSASDEMIVDDLDTNFHVVHPQKKWRLSGLRGGNFKGKYRYVLAEVTKRWTPVLDKCFYGDSIRSAYCKTAGGGGKGVEWRVSIDKPGRYEVFVYVSDRGGMSVIRKQRKPGTTYFYTIRHAREETEVALTYREGMFGWVSLGKFQMERGESSVILDDRVAKDSSLIMTGIPALIVADAVKWKYKGE